MCGDTSLPSGVTSFCRLTSLPAGAENENSWTDSKLEVNWAGEAEKQISEEVRVGWNQSLKQADKPGANGRVKGSVELQSRWNENKVVRELERQEVVAREQIFRFIELKTVEVILVQPPICCRNFFIHSISKYVQWGGNLLFSWKDLAYVYRPKFAFLKIPCRF